MKRMEKFSDFSNLQAQKGIREFSKGMKKDNENDEEDRKKKIKRVDKEEKEDEEAGRSEKSCPKASHSTANDPEEEDNLLREASSPADVEKVWYFQSSSDEGIVGPCNVVYLQGCYEAGYIDGLTLIWCEGMSGWLSISECPEVKELLMRQVGADEDEEEPYNEENSCVDEVSFYQLVDSAQSSVQNKAERTTQSEEDEAVGANQASIFTEEASGLTDEMQKKLRNSEKRRRYRDRLKLKKSAGVWLKGKTNPNVYVEGLPGDATIEEAAQFFKRAGVLKIDPETMGPKIRLYRNEDGTLKGDALVSYVNEASVALALKYLDATSFRGVGEEKLKVVRAEFDGNRKTVGNENEKAHHIATEDLQAIANSSKYLQDKKKYLAAKYEQSRLLSWGGEMDDGFGKHIVIFKPMFSRAEAEEHEEGDPFYSELKEEIKEEISKYVSVEKVTVIERHPHGVACVRFKTTEEAESAIAHFKDRFFAGKALEVYFFNGKTDLKAECLPSKKKMASSTYSSSGKTTLETEKPVKSSVHTPTGEEQTLEKAAISEEEKGGKKQRKEGGSEPPASELLKDYCFTDEKRIKKFGDWLEDQSSDEEFDIRTEDTAHQED